MWLVGLGRRDVLRLEVKAMKRVAVLGAGNAGCAMAAHLARQGLEVRLYNRWEDEIRVLKQQGGIYLKGCLGEGFVPIPVITTDLEEALRGADFVAVVTPATAHEFFARAVAPYIKAGTPVLLNPGHTCGALHFRKVLREAGGPPVDICETNTNIYICRLTAPGEVTVYNVGGVFFAALPGERLAALAELVGKIAPTIRPVPSVLDTGFANVNAIMHPAAMLLNTGWIEHGSGFYFYAEGATPGVASIMAAVDRERLEVMRALGLRPVPFVEVFYQYGATSQRALESGSMYEALRDSEPNRLIRAPQSMTHRFLAEDIPHGLVPMESFGRLVGVKTPVITALIELACVINGVDYRKEGLTLEKLGLGGMDVGAIMQYVQHGE